MIRVLASLAVVFFLLAARSAAAAPPPNIVLILADDLGWGDPGCQGTGSRIPMPNIDRLAGEGMRLTDAHAPSAVCTPTRYGLLTGRCCWRTRLTSGVLWNGWAAPLVEPDRPTIASVLKARGYRTAATGKWHLGWQWASQTDAPVTASSHDHVDYDRPVSGGPCDVGFDTCFVIPASLDMAPYCWLRDDRVVAAPTGHTDASRRRWQGGGGYWRAGPIAPGFEFEDVLPAVTERAVAVIDDAAAAVRRGDDAPFFLYVPLPAPHTPHVPAPEFQGATDVGWYGDFTAQTDWAIGRVLAALDRNALADDTIVVVTSDNGAHWPAAQIERFEHDANGGLRGQKADIWEGGHRIPLVVRWPGHIPAGATSAALFSLVDLFPTLTAFAGAELPAGAAEDGVDQSAVLLDLDTALARTHMVQHSLNGTFAIRSGRWKLIEGHTGSGGFTAPVQPAVAEGDPPGQLYDLEADPGERQNLWLEEPEVVAALLALLADRRDVAAPAIPVSTQP